MRNLWVSDTRKTLVCIDSYVDGVPKGQFFAHGYDPVPFSSMSQFLIGMEEMLDQSSNTPQSYTSPRRFTDVSDPFLSGSMTPAVSHGNLATFEVAVLFRQNTSWQGTLRWKDTGKDESFRSVLELILLMDSALRSSEE